MEETMVRIYQQAEESYIKRLENELNLQEVYLLGIRSDNNCVIVREKLEVPSRNYKISEGISIIEDDSVPIHLYSYPGTKIFQRCEKGEDLVIDNIEKNLGLRGIYVFGIDNDENIVIVHRGSKTKRLYVEIFGYGPTPEALVISSKIFDPIGGEVTLVAVINICAETNMEI
jgi:hypothetical protein